MPAILVLASSFKGNRFLERLKQQGCTVYLLTIEEKLTENWARQACDEVFAVPSFLDYRGLINTVALLMRSRKIDRIIALDDFDVEIAAYLREHFRMTDTGPGESSARLFRDKLAMRVQARELGIRIPEFCPLFHHDTVREFLARVPAPWLIKPRSEASAAGIRILQTPDEVWHRIEELADDQSFCLIEQLVPGRLFHVDSLAVANRIAFAEVNMYWRPLLDVYQGGGIYATRTQRRDHPDVAILQRLNAEVLTGFQFNWGASHTEFMKAHADGQFYFIETSARVGGANTAEMVEAATGVNLWSEWAAIACDRSAHYQAPVTRQRYAGVITALARQEKPDTSSFTDREITHRLEKKHHIGFVLAADTPERIEELLAHYMQRIARDYQADTPIPNPVRAS